MKINFRGVYLQISRESTGVKYFDESSVSSVRGDPSKFINHILSEFERKLAHKKLQYSGCMAERLYEVCYSVISGLVPI